MIIKDIYGYKLSLTKTTLREVTGETVPGEKWSLKLSSLKGSGFSSRPVLFRPVNVNDWEYYKGSEQILMGAAHYDPTRRNIGCRKFDAKTFKVILKAIKEAK